MNWAYCIFFICAAVIFHVPECPAREGHIPQAAAEGAYKGFGYPWENNRLGITDKVPEPWTPLTYSEGKTGCWGREFIMEKGILPGQITSQGQKLFKRAPSLELRVDGRPVAALSEKTPVQKLKSEQRAEWEISSVEGDLKVSGKSSLEFDGFFRVDISLSPLKPSKIENLVLTLPLDREVARFYTSFIDYDFEKQVPVRQTMAEGIGPIEEKLEFGFNPAVWIGNHRVGIEWVCESDIGWSNGDRSKQIRIEPNGDTVLLRVNFISKPVTAGGTLNFSFALYPTPVKKLSDNWRRKVIVPADRAPQPISAETHDIYGLVMGLPVRYPGLPLIAPSEKPVTPGGGLRAQSPEKFIERLRSRMESRKIRFIPYSSLYGMPGRLPANEWKDYAGLWRTMSGRGDAFNKNWAAWANLPPGEPSIISICLFPKSLQDFYVWQFVEGIKKYDTDGMYLDLTAPLSLCRNPNHPHGEAVSKGAQYYPYFAQRELMKRLYTECKSIRPDFAMVVHQAKITVACCGFADMALSGEFMSPRFLYGRQYEPDYGLFPDVFYEIQFQHSRGFPVFLHPQVIKWDREKMTGDRQLLRRYTMTLLARTAVFDIPIYPGRMDMESYERYVEGWKRFGWKGNIIHAGPRESRKYIRGKNEGLALALYFKPEENKLMLAAANLGKKKQDARISLDLEALRREAGVNLGKEYSLADALDNSPLELRDGEVRLELAPDEYRLIIAR